ncbi:MAG: hypothetical protein DBY20_08275 [Coriobacteriia bacterium]|nr:MAG: hypothetical protein DBY20_08275 [Coriobacteriia bacterium]
MIVTSNPRKGVVIMNKPLVFTLGAAVGAVAALLLSPNSGERNREIVADKVDYYTAHGEQVFQQTADTVRNKVRGVADVATNADADDIREKINEARDRIAEQITRNSSVPQDVAADVSDVAADAAESVSEAADTAADAAEGAAKAAADAVKSK